MFASNRLLCSIQLFWLPSKFSPLSKSRFKHSPRKSWSIICVFLHPSVINYLFCDPVRQNYIGQAILVGEYNGCIQNARLCVGNIKGPKYNYCLMSECIRRTTERPWSFCSFSLRACYVVLFPYFSSILLVLNEFELRAGELVLSTSFFALVSTEVRESKKRTKVVKKRNVWESGTRYTHARNKRTGEEDKNKRLLKWLYQNLCGIKG